MSRWRRLQARADLGASAVEYALLLAGIAAVVVASVFLFGTFVTDSFARSCETLNAQFQQDADCVP